MAENEVAQAKACSKCARVKPNTVEFFHRASAANRRRNPHALVAECKECAHARQARASRTAPEKARRRNRDHRARNLEKERARWRAVAAARADEVRRAYNSDPAARLKKLASGRAWYQANKERRLAAGKKWASENRENRRASKSAYERDRYRSNPKVMIRKRMSAAVRASLSWELAGKKSDRSWQALVGYTASDLKAHIERQFLAGMSWDNAGDWHIDHIVPVSSFTFTSFECADFRACWALTNLRPLWAEENMKKGAKVLNLL